MPARLDSSFSPLARSSVTMRRRSAATAAASSEMVSELFASVNARRDRSDGVGNLPEIRRSRGGSCERSEGSEKPRRSREPFGVRKSPWRRPGRSPSAESAFLDDSGSVSRVRRGRGGLHERSEGSEEPSRRPENPPRVRRTPRRRSRTVPGLRISLMCDFENPRRVRRTPWLKNGTLGGFRRSAGGNSEPSEGSMRSRWSFGDRRTVRAGP